MKKFFWITVGLAMLLAGCCNGNKAQDATEAAINTIMNRKSVRSFTDQKLTEQQIETLMKAAMAAPSAINIQPWHFVVVTDKQQLAALAKANPYAGMAAKAPLAIVALFHKVLALPIRHIKQRLWMRKR